MQFVCNQNWDAMDVTERGRYCHQCKKEVHDFTSQTQKQIQEYKSKNSHPCGIFTAEQVYDDIITPISLKSFRKFAAAAATLLMLTGAKAIAQQKDSVQTEQLQTWQPGGENKSNICIPKEEEKISRAHYDKYLFSVGRRNIYLTRRFPFIAARRPHLMGFF